MQGKEYEESAGTSFKKSYRQRDLASMTFQNSEEEIACKTGQEGDLSECQRNAKHHRHGKCEPCLWNTPR